MTWHDMTWHDIMSHDVTWYCITWHLTSLLYCTTFETYVLLSMQCDTESEMQQRHFSKDHSHSPCLWSAWPTSSSLHTSIVLAVVVVLLIHHSLCWGADARKERNRIEWNGMEQNGRHAGAAVTCRCSVTDHIGNTTWRWAWSECGNTKQDLHER